MEQCDFFIRQENMVLICTVLHDEEEGTAKRRGRRAHFLVTTSVILPIRNIETVAQGIFVNLVRNNSISRPFAGQPPLPGHL